MSETVNKKPQIDKFRETAKELECNESEKDFDRKLKKLAEKRPEKNADSQ